MSTLNRKKYPEMVNIHDECLKRLAGKGEVHHGDEDGFLNQDWVMVRTCFTDGITLGQALKKMLQYQRTGDEDELLDAMNYLGMELIWHRHVAEDEDG